MHQTTVRFTSDLWIRLEQEAQRTGVSAAQYVRDATLARMERSAVAPAAAADEVALALPASTDAVRAQAQLARERARSLRVAAETAAARRPQGRTDA